VLLLVHPSPQPKRQIDPFSNFAQLTARVVGHARACPSPNNCPFISEIWAPSNACFLGPIRVYNRNGSSIGSAVFAQITAERPCILQWPPCRPQYCPFQWRDLHPHLVHDSLGQSQHITQTASAVFAQLSAEYPSTLQWAAPSLKIAPFHGGILTPLSNTWFLAPTRVLNPNGFSIGSAIFAGLMIITGRQTDRPQHSVTIGCIYVNCPFHVRGSGPPSNTWFFGPTRVIKPNGISIGAAIFAGLTSVTDRPTNRQTESVGNNRPHLST